jgi:hypothetical protein
MLANLFFQMLDSIKLYHWKTKSYPRHIATDNLHSDLSGLVDKFVEIYMGKYGRQQISTNSPIQLKTLTDDNAEEHLSNWIKMLESGFDDMIDELNIRDEMLGLLNKTLYLFTLN